MFPTLWTVQYFQTPDGRQRVLTVSESLCASVPDPPVTLVKRICSPELPTRWGGVRTCALIYLWVCACVWLCVGGCVCVCVRHDREPDIQSQVTHLLF